MSVSSNTVVGKLIRFFNMDRVRIESKPVSSDIDAQLVNCTELENQADDVAAYEYLLGAMLVAEERVWIRRRCRTIARSHIETASWKSMDRWILESRALVRYFDTVNDRDAQTAREMLLPFELKFNSSRSPTLKSTVGQQGQITTKTFMS